MNQRTPEDMIAMKPVEITLGEKKYSIKPLPRGKPGESGAALWKEKYAKVASEASELSILASPPDQANLEAWAKDQFGQKFLLALYSIPDKLADLLFDYAPELPREEILCDATDEQIVVAFSTVFQLAYPSFGTVGTMMMTGKAMQSQASRYTN